MRNELLAIDDAAREDILRIGNGFNLDLHPPIPEPIHLAVLRQARHQTAAHAERHGRTTAGEA